MKDANDKYPDGLLLSKLFLRQSCYDNDVKGTMAHTILTLLYTHCDKNGMCFNSISKIANNFGVKRQSIQYHIRRLRELGYLIVTYPDGDINRKRTNIYHLNYKKFSSLSAERGVCTPTADTGVCSPLQTQYFAVPAYSGICTKKTNKKTIEENTIKKRREQNSYFQRKERERNTGITSRHEIELGHMKQKALQGKTVMQRTQIDLSIQQEARDYSSVPLEQINFMINRYAEMSRLQI